MTTKTTGVLAMGAEELFICKELEQQRYPGNGSKAMREEENARQEHAGTSQGNQVWPVGLPRVNQRGKDGRKEG